MTNIGFFSVVQACPDRDMCECVNVGVVLFVPQTGFVGVRLDGDNERVRRRFGDAHDVVRLDVAKKSFEARLRSECAEWRNPEDLQRFGRREGNLLGLVPPKVVLVEDAPSCLKELFDRFVRAGL